MLLRSKVDDRWRYVSFEPDDIRRWFLGLLLTGKSKNELVQICKWIMPQNRRMLARN